MRRFILLLISAILLQSTCFALTTPFSEDPIAAKTFLQLDGKRISLQDYLLLTPSTYNTLTGKRLGILGTIKLKLAQRELKKLLAHANSNEAKRTKKAFANSDFHTGGYALGMFLGPLGVLIAYLINDDYKHERVKWAWWGLLAFASIVLLVLQLSMAAV